MKKLLYLLLPALLCGACSDSKVPAGDDITVAVYYFPGYHTREAGDLPYDHRHGNEWTEWELVQEARPRFEGHQQPNVPLWGYEDERDPAVMSRKIAAAADHGIDVFIFDWYYFDEGPFLNRALDEGFLGAPNSGRLDFALMWANHTWSDIFPITGGETPEPIHPGRVSPETFDKIGAILVNQYFTQPNYWKIDGKPYFSIYDVPTFLSIFDTQEELRAGMDRWEEKARAAGLRGIHWNMVIHGNPTLVDDSHISRAEVFRELGINSGSSYMTFHQVDMPERETDLNALQADYLTFWAEHKKELGLPYIYNVTKGFDPSPRTNQQTEWSLEKWTYPYWNTISGNDPAGFKKALERTRDSILADPATPNILILAAWNEWTEDCYIEPDTVDGMGHLEAIREVFGK